jgi:predicted PurR-regulated permease PerM
LSDSPEPVELAVEEVARMPSSAPAGPAPATPYEKAAWILAAAALLLILSYRLVPALVAGLFVTVLLHRLAHRIAGPRVSHGSAKLLAAALVGVSAIGIATGVALLLVGLIRGHVGDVPALIQKMAQVLDETRLWLEERGGPSFVPDTVQDADQLKQAAAAWLREHAVELRRTGGELGRAIVHIAVGIAVGVLIFFHPRSYTPGPLARALAERGRRLADAFEAIVFAQVKISALNTVLTGLYLLLLLPILGVHLPFAGTLVAITFLTGLLPVVGNLISNTVIVVISLGVSAWVALGSLAFLVVIHKLEYFTNARIVGRQIQAAAWEMLIALLAFEAVFGVPGLVLAPIVYAWVKKELTDRGLV